MNRIECEYEPDALMIALQARWPARVDASMKAHIGACPACSDVVLIASAIERDLEQMRAVNPEIPDSGRVWWRAQIRVQREAAETAGHPITATQLVGFVCVAGLLGACFGATSAWFQSVLGRLVSAIEQFGVSELIPSAAALIAEHGILISMLAAVLFILPAAVYFAVLRD